MSTPIHRITDETLLEILEYACCRPEIEVGKDKQAAALGTNTAWVITRVCQRWEGIALQMKIQQLVHTEIGRIVLSISNGDVDIEIDRDDDSGGYPTGRKTLPINVVLPIIFTFGKLQRLSIIIRPNAFAELAKLFEAHVGNLQSLRIEFSESSRANESWKREQYEQFRSLKTFADLSRLQALILPPVLVNILPLPPLQQIHHFGLTNTPETCIYDIRHILEGLEHIESLDLEYQDNHENGKDEHGRDTLEHSTEQLILPNITSLKTTIYAFSVMEFLTLPALKTCIIHYSPTDDRQLDQLDFDLKSEFWVGLVERSSAHLDRLRITLDTEIEEGAEVKYVEALEHTNSLRHLEIERVHMPFEHDDLNELFEHFEEASSNDFLPKLKNVDIYLTIWAYDSGMADAYEEAAERLRQVRPEVPVTVYYNGQRTNPFI
jgi:hypothetical protein